MSHSNDGVAEYYDSHQFFYTHFWSPTALHYGFWYKDTRTLAEAITNANKYVVDALAIDSRDVVLDAGCGVGGTSLYIAETTSARVEGVTLSRVQLNIAKKKAAQSNVARLLNFSRQDYRYTNFADATFSVVFAIESVCHAVKKDEFLKEAYRVMKPGGRIAIVDAFLTKEDLTSEERRIYARSISGWAVPNLASRDQFLEFLAQARFKNVIFKDMQRCIWRSVRRIYYYSWLTYPINLVKVGLGITSVNNAARYQKHLFERKIAAYGVFIARKPS